MPTEPRQLVGPSIMRNAHRMKSSLPDDVTKEDLARWTAEAEADAAANPDVSLFSQIFPGFKPSDYRVRWCAAQWLSRSLDEAGCDPELNGRICFANGQIVFHSDEPWQVAQDALANFRQGKWETPGYELSQRLFKQHLPHMIRRYGQPDLAAAEKLRKQFESGELKAPDAPFPYDPV